VTSARGFCTIDFECPREIADVALLGGRFMNRTIGPIAALVLLASPALAQAPAADTRALAQALVVADGSRGQTQQQVAGLESKFSQLIVGALGPLDRAREAKVKAMAERSLAPTTDRIVNAKVQFYAANFSAAELSEILAFLRSTAGGSDTAKLPAMRAAVARVLLSSPAERKAAREAGRAAFAAAPAPKRDLIERILLAQDVEGQSRRDGAALAKTLSAVTHRAGAGQPTAADDDYAATVVAIEQGFYATNFIYYHLAVIAAYLESPGGKAALARAPVLRRTVGEVVRVQLETALAAIDRDACGAIACTAEQRSGLDDFSGVFRRMLPLFTALGD
jgi:hypothetical protein